MEDKMLSDLEMMVCNDMSACGYDPHNTDDVNEYWEIMLNGN
jgi:hypothetical protein